MEINVIKYVLREYIGDIYVELDPPVNEKINEQVIEFSQQMQRKKQTAYYSQFRRSGKTKSAKQDVPLGKKAEFIAAYGLHEFFNVPLVMPDLQIYRKRDKNWDCDLIYGRTGNAHVKACSQHTLDYCGDFSWVFQYANKGRPGGTDQVFKAPSNDFLVGVFMEDFLSHKGIIKIVLPIERVKLLLRDPVNVWLKDIKKCLYYQDLFK